MRIWNSLYMRTRTSQMTDQEASIACNEKIVCFNWAYFGNGPDAAASIAPTIRHWVIDDDEFISLYVISSHLISSYLTLSINQFIYLSTQEHKNNNQNDIKRVKRDRRALMCSALATALNCTGRGFCIKISGRQGPLSSLVQFG